MDTIKTIIVDDERAARDVLSNLLLRTSKNIDIVATCENVPDAVKKIKEHQPDLVFLDVQMPDYAGYEIVNFFDEINFEIVFVTAYDQYAVKAFELSAVDYIVKPIERSRLKEAVEKVNGKLEQRTNIENYKVLMESIKAKELGKIIISELNDGQVTQRIIQLKDIIAIEAEGAYSKVFLQNNAPLIVSRNLSFFESKLPDDKCFFRSHRSWIINLDYIEKYNPRFGNVLLQKNIDAKLSKNKQNEFEQKQMAL